MLAVEPQVNRYDPCLPSSSQPKEDGFPWARLPKELQVKVLKNLQRRDLCQCRTLNSEMSKIIRNNERSMKRRRLDLVRIERKAFIDLYHVAVTAAPADPLALLGERSLNSEPSSSTELPSAIVDRLMEVTKGSQIDRLRINEVGDVCFRRN
ncbi:hypothetical protein Aduo_002470 [Ancylostoma duodenale]